MNITAEPAQFTAIGHFTHSPDTEDITKQVTWKSSDEMMATINSSGVATATGFGSATITAASNAGQNHALVTGSATLTVGNSNIPFLIVERAGTGTGSVTSVPAGIDCGQTCSAPYTAGSTIILTAIPDAGSTFASWMNCDSGSGTACTVVVNSTRTVTASFN